MGEGAFEDGRIVSVSSSRLGDTLAADAATSDQTLFLNDTSDFDEQDFGTLSVGGSQYEYDAVDNDASTVHLTTGLAAGVDAGERVDVWDTSLGEVAIEVRARVEIPGRQANDDPLDCEVAQSLAMTLPPGIREPGAGENCTLQLNGLTWVVVDVKGKRPTVQPQYGGSSVVTGDSSGAGSVSISGTISGSGTSTASGADAVAVGDGAEASGTESVALGTSIASGYKSVAAGSGAQATAANAVAIGDHAIAAGLQSIAIGNGVTAPNPNDAVIGTSNNNVSIPGAFGIGAATPVNTQPTPVTLADVIAILQAYGFCA